MTAKERLEQLQAEIVEAIQRFEIETQLKVRQLEPRRTGVSSNPPDAIWSVYIAVN